MIWKWNGETHPFYLGRREIGLITNTLDEMRLGWPENSIKINSVAFECVLNSRVPPMVVNRLQEVLDLFKQCEYIYP
jgi:hypothetical protein